VEQYGALVGSFDEPFWTLPQVLVWALVRDPKLVDLAAPSEVKKPGVAAQLTHKVHLEYSKRVSGPALKATLESIKLVRERALEEERGLRPKSDQPNFRELLRRYQPAAEGVPNWPDNLIYYFRRGELKAWGNERGRAKASEISKVDWAGLELASGPQGLCVWRIGHRDPRAQGDYEDVRIERDSVLKVFPANPAGDAPELGARSSLGPTYSASSAKALKRDAAAQALIRLFPDGRPSLNLNELRRELQKRAPGIGGVSDSTVKRAIALAWPAAGSNRVK
jgi:hypothetical protein